MKTPYSRRELKAARAGMRWGGVWQEKGRILDAAPCKSPVTKATLRRLLYSGVGRGQSALSSDKLRVDGSQLLSAARCIGVASLLLLLPPSALTLTLRSMEAEKGGRGESRAREGPGLRPCRSLW